jgi:hypothetical protein
MSMKYLNNLYKNAGIDINWINYIFSVIENWCIDFNLTLAISGSAIGKVYKMGMDFDFIIISPDENINNKRFYLPDIFLQAGWKFFIKNTDKFNIYGTYTIDNPLNRFEFYFLKTAFNILNLKEIEIIRLKQTPKEIKEEKFFNSKSNTINNKIIPLKTRDWIQSTTKNVIKHNNNIYWGMHFERLFLLDLIFDYSGFKTLHVELKTNLINSLFDNRFDDLFKSCFYVTQNMTPLLFHVFISNFLEND